MTPREMVVLARYVKACCPHQPIDEYTPDAWFEIIGDLDFNDCRQAVKAIVSRQPFCAPAEIKTEVKRVREDRVKAQPLPAPPSEPGPYVDQLRTSIKQVADGFRPPPAIGSGRRGGPNAEFIAARQQSGQQTRRPNRDAVLSYPDLAARLTEPPLDYPKPEQWTGFIPPEMFNNQRNSSPQRAALAEIAAEAHARDAAS